MARSRVALGVVALVALVTPTARAATCAPVAAVGVTNLGVAAIDPELRLRWIDETLARSAGRARLWTWGWSIALAAGAVANLAPLPFVAPAERVDWYTGAVTNVAGVVPLVIAPLDVIADSRALDARLATRGATEVCALLADAEARLVRDAQNQADGQRWWLHVGNVALNAGVGLFLIVGFHHWGAGLWNFASGAAIGEVIILTQPSGALDGLARYRAGALDDGAPPRASLGFSRAF